MTANRPARVLISWAACLLGAILLPGPDVRGQSAGQPPATDDKPAHGVVTFDYGNNGQLDYYVTGDQVPVLRLDNMYGAFTPPESPLGLALAPADRSLRTQLKLPEGQGLVVVSVNPGGPAERVGLKANDILLSIGDEALETPRDLPIRLEKAGEAVVELKLIRDGEPTTLRVKPVYRVSFGPAEDERPDYFIGVATAPVDATLRSHLKALPEGRGLVVTEVVAESPAAGAGVTEGDILLELGETPLTDFETLAARVQALGESAATLRLIRGGEPREVTVTPRPRPKPAKEEAQAVEPSPSWTWVRDAHQPYLAWLLQQGQPNGASVAEMVWGPQPGTFSTLAEWQGIVNLQQLQDRRRAHELVNQLNDLVELQIQERKALGEKVTAAAGDGLEGRLDALTEQVQALAKSVEDLRRVIEAEKADRPRGR